MWSDLRQILMSLSFPHAPTLPRSKKCRQLWQNDLTWFTSKWSTKTPGNICVWGQWDIQMDSKLGPYRGLSTGSTLAPCESPIWVNWWMGMAHSSVMHLSRTVVHNSHGANVEPQDNPIWGPHFVASYKLKGLRIQMLAGTVYCQTTQFICDPKV